MGVENAGNKNSTCVVDMFNDIAPTYDKINHRLSFGIDKIWRRKLRRTIKQLNHSSVLDMAAGTGDLTIELAKLNPHILFAADPSEKMLEIAEKKLKKSNIKCELTKCNAEKTPFDANYFDSVSCAFGIRNFESLENGLAEIYRILKPNGHIAILEFGMPANMLWRLIYKFYFNLFIPIIGRRMSKNKTAYSYLNSTVKQFPYGSDFLNILEEHKYKMVRIKKLSGGISWIYIAKKIIA